MYFEIYRWCLNLTNHPVYQYMCANEIAQSNASYKFEVSRSCLNLTQVALSSVKLIQLKNVKYENYSGNAGTGAH